MTFHKGVRLAKECPVSPNALAGQITGCLPGQLLRSGAEPRHVPLSSHRSSGRNGGCPADHLKFKHENMKAFMPFGRDQEDFPVPQ